MAIVDKPSPVEMEPDQYSSGRDNLGLEPIEEHLTLREALEEIAAVGLIGSLLVGGAILMPKKADDAAVGEEAGIAHEIASAQPIKAFPSALVVRAGAELHVAPSSGSDTVRATDDMLYIYPPEEEVDGEPWIGLLDQRVVDEAVRGETSSDDIAESAEWVRLETDNPHIDVIEIDSQSGIDEQTLIFTNGPGHAATMGSVATFSGDEELVIAEQIPLSAGDDPIEIINIIAQTPNP